MRKLVLNDDVQDVPWRTVPRGPAHQIVQRGEAGERSYKLTVNGLSKSGTIFDRQHYVLHRRAALFRFGAERPRQPGYCGYPTIRCASVSQRFRRKQAAIERGDNVVRPGDCSSGSAAMTSGRR